MTSFYSRRSDLPLEVENETVTPGNVYQSNLAFDASIRINKAR